MSSAPDSIAAGTVLQHYRLVERLGGAGQTWRAEDTRNGNSVAVKILTRTLPKDKPTRDSALKQIRLKAAISHPGLASVIQLDIDQDVLWMASELVEGESLTRHAQRGKADKQSFLRYAWQMADILAAVHASGVVFGRITGESWIITPDNDIKLVGLGFSSFMGKHETGQTLISGIKATHLREASYLSPEQVNGKMVTSKADIFALGVCLYELIAGNVPFHGASLSDVAHAVTTASPPAPQNPGIDRSFLAPVGKCIHKNPDNRYEKVAMLKDDLLKLAPDIDSVARRRGVTSPGGIPVPKKATESATEAFIVVGELPYHDLIRSKDPGRASRLENTMQQFLSEAVYLFDGKVLDSLGPVMIASLPDGESAIKAAQKGLADLVEHNMTHGDEPVEARMLVHFGELIPTAGKPEGAGLLTAMSVLEAMEPLQLLVSKPVIDRVDVDGEVVSIGRLAEIDFFQAPKLREPAPVTAPEPTPEAPAPVSVKLPAETAPAPAPATPEAVAVQPPPKKGLSLMAVGAVAFLVISAGAISAFFVLRNGGEKPPAPVALAPRPVAPPVAKVEIDPNKIYFEAFEMEPAVNAVEPVESVEQTPDSAAESGTAAEVGEAIAAPEVSTPGADTELVEIGSRLRAAVSSVIGFDSGVEILDGPAEDARTIGGRISRSTEGVVLTPFFISGETRSEIEPIIVDDVIPTAVAYVRQLWPALERDLSFLPADDTTVVGYLEARALQEQGEIAKALVSIQGVTRTHTDFLAGLRLQMDLLLAVDEQDKAVETAKRIAILDPKDTEIRRRLGDWEFARGNPGYGLIWLGELLQVEPDNPEILTRVGQYTLAVGNEEKFRAVLAKLSALEIENPRLSEGDLILSRGRLDAAAKKYYEDLNTQPDNAILALKIGRLAVLRRSDSVIQAEIEKLQELQAPFELAMMRAYIDANEGNAEAAEIALKQAEELAGPLDPLYTASAEVYLLLNRQTQVLDALNKATERSEPTHEYILSNPIFGYLSSDPRFRTVLQKIGDQRTRISAALDNIEL